MLQKTSVEPDFGRRIDVPQAGEGFGCYGSVSAPALMDVGANPDVPPSSEGFYDDGDGKLTTDATKMRACQNPLARITL